MNINDFVVITSHLNKRFCLPRVILYYLLPLQYKFKLFCYNHPNANFGVVQYLNFNSFAKCRLLNTTTNVNRIQ